MKKSLLNAQQIQCLEVRYRELAAELASFDSLSQGSVMPNGSQAWRWTRKVGGKTVSLGLSSEQALKMKQAIANHRRLKQIIDEMGEITNKIILETDSSTQK